MVEVSRLNIQRLRILFYTIEILRGVTNNGVRPDLVRDFRYEALTHAIQHIHFHLTNTVMRATVG